jgi:hypothetical protein
MLAEQVELKAQLAAQLQATQAELATAREQARAMQERIARAEALNPDSPVALESVGAELAAAQQRESRLREQQVHLSELNEQLHKQLQAVGTELAAEREQQTRQARLVAQLTAQLQAVGAELAAARANAAELAKRNASDAEIAARLTAQLQAVGAELAAERKHSAAERQRTEKIRRQLVAQLKGVAAELAAERKRAPADADKRTPDERRELLAQLHSVGAELIAEREQSRKLRDQLAALSRAPSDADPWVTLGHLNLRLERPVQAEEAFREALSRQPATPGVLDSLAHGLAQVGCWREAVQAAEASLRERDDPAMAVFLGDCLMNSAATGYREAEPAYRRAAEAGSAAAQRGLGECFARSGKLNEARDAHEAWFQHWIKSSQSSDLRSRQDAARARGVPPIAMVAMQKSASEYIRANLLQALGLPEIAVGVGTVPRDRAVRPALRQLATGGALCRTHMSGDNAAAMAQAGIARMLLHVRDPRQVTVSWAHMMRRITDHEFIYAAGMYTPAVPDAYRDWSFEEQFAWAVENYLPGQLDWLEGWVRALDAGLPLRICITTFEQFRDDQDAFYRRVLEFFEAPLADAGVLQSRTAEAMRNFRSGRTSEWRRLFTSAQKSAIEARVAPLAERFGWAL